MSDEQTTPAPAVTPPATPAPQEPVWLPERLERAKQTAQRELLSQLGVNDVSEVKTALDELKRKRESELTDMQKLQERVKQLEPLEQRVQTYTATMAAMAQSALGGLTDSQKSAVAALAGDDPARQLQIIEALRPTWASAPAAPANTVPNVQPPQPATVATPNHEQTWRDLQKRNPVAAAHYRLRYAAEIDKQIATKIT